MRPWLVLPVLAFLTALTYPAAAAPCGGSTPCNCGDTLTSSYTMTTDLLNCQAGLTIGEAYVTLDCNGYTIASSGFSFKPGVNAGRAAFATIQNCNIQNYWEGILLNRTGTARLNNLTGSLNNLRIVDYYGGMNTVYGNRLENGVQHGALVGAYTVYNLFYNNTFINNDAYESGQYNFNFWNNAQIAGNAWSDFSSNPGYPDIYYIAGPGNGVDYHPSGGSTALECGDYIGQNTTLGRDYINCSTHGFRFTNDDLALDCAGHRISSDRIHFNTGNAEAQGVGLSGHSGVTVKNCRIDGFTKDISVSGGNSNLIVNNDLGEALVGIDVTDSANNTVEDANVSSTGFYGVSLTNGNANVIRRVRSLGNSVAFMLRTSHNNSLISPQAENSQNGFTLDASRSNLIQGALIRNATQYGVLLDSSHLNNITDTRIEKATQGVRIYWSSNANLVQNTVLTQNAYGAYLVYGSGNTFYNNTFFSNAQNAYELSGATSTQWNNATHGNMWDDFPSNPGYPNYYVIPGPGSGIDYHPVGASSPLCGSSLTQNAVLTDDVLNCAGDGLLIGADNITLDCAGHLIDGTQDPASVGIALWSRRQVTVGNCRVQEFGTGILLNSSDHNLLSGNTVANNVEGIALLASPNNTLQANTASSNLFAGVLLSNPPVPALVAGMSASGPPTVESTLFSAENLLVNNTLEGNDYGLILEMGSDYNRIQGNQLLNNPSFGAYLDDSRFNTFLANAFSNPTNAFETSLANSNLWNLSNVGNAWSDFSSNPGYPFAYNISGFGGGVDYHPAGASIKYPILFVHGYCGEPGDNGLVLRLRQEGFDVTVLDYAEGSCPYPYDGPGCSNHDIKGYGPAVKTALAQIRARTGAAKVDIIAHSMGGLVSRWYLESLDYAEDVRQLIMLGTPNHGSRWAQLEWLNPIEFQGIELAHCFGKGEAALQMQPKSAFLAKLNYGEDEFNWAKWQTDPEILNPSIPYQVIVGTNWSVGGFQTPVTRKTAKHWYNPDGVHAGHTRNGDGLVAVYMSRLLNPATGCDEFASSHGGLTEDSAPQAEVLLYLKLPVPKADNCTYEDKVPRPSKVLTAEPGLAFSPIRADVIAQGQSQQKTVLVDPTVLTALFGLVWENESANMNFTLQAPNGTLYTPESPEYSNVSSRRYFAIDAPVPGEWSLTVVAETVAGTEAYQARASFTAPLVLDIMSASENYSVPPGEAFEIQAYLTDGVALVLAEEMAAEILRPGGGMDALALFDDGLHNDGTASDGIYGNYYFPPLLGAYEVRVTASGTYNAQLFERQDETTFWAEVFPDLTPTALWSVPNVPTEGQTAALSANITNLGDGLAQDAEIRFFEGSPANGTLLGTARVNVSINATTTASISWTAVRGGHNITASVSPFNAFLEADYGNNELSRTIVVALQRRRGGSPLLKKLLE